MARIALKRPEQNRDKCSLRGVLKVRDANPIIQTALQTLAGSTRQAPHDKQVAGSLASIQWFPSAKDIQNDVLLTLLLACLNA